MRRQPQKVYTITLTLAGLLAASCNLFGGNAENQAPPQFDAAVSLLESGIQKLERGDYTGAKLDLKELVAENSQLAVALLHDPAKKNQAHYAFVLANLLWQANEWVTQLGKLIGVVDSLGIGANAPGLVDVGA
jgi:hypothetical protein